MIMIKNGLGAVLCVVALGSVPADAQHPQTAVRAPGANYGATAGTGANYAGETCDELHRIDPSTVDKRIAVTCRWPERTTYFTCNARNGRMEDCRRGSV